MIKTVETEIEGFQFRLTQLGAIKAAKQLTRIGKIAGPALGKLGELAGDKLLSANVGALGDAAGALFAQLTEAELEDLIRTFLGDAMIREGSMGNFAEFSKVGDTLLGGRVGVLLRALWWAIEVNYGDFFVSLRALVARKGATGSSSAASST